VSVAINASALPSGAGNKNGWYVFGGGQSGSNHNVSILGYGPTADLFKALGVASPANAPPVAYLTYTWSTIGVTDFPWIKRTVEEGWVRNPTVMDLAPPPPPVGTITVAVANVTGSVGQPVNFAPVASGGTSPYMFIFDYGDSSQGASVSHTYKTGGVWQIMVTAIDSRGGMGTGTCTATIGITPPPPPPPGPTPTGLIVTLPQSTPAGTYQLVLPSDLDEIQRRLDAIRGGGK
jgi:hypothetical protein